MAAQRRVRTVRLRAAEDSLVRRGALLLEDALRTATIPEAGGGRLLLFRTLRVGRIRQGQSPASVALTIEQRIHELAPAAVHAERAGAASCEAVYFRDALEAHVALAVRVATRAPTDAWFWPLAVPAWAPALPRDAALRALLFSALRTSPGTSPGAPGGAVAGAAMVGEAAARGALDALLAALRWQDGPALLRACGWSGARLAPGEAVAPATGAPVGSDPRGARERPGDAPPPPPWLGALERWVERWGAEDARSAWLAASLLVADRPIHALEPALPARARALLGTLSPAARRAERAVDTPRRAPPDAPPPPAALDDTDAHAGGARDTTRAPRAEDDAAPLGTAPPRDAPRPPAAAASPSVTQRRDTSTPAASARGTERAAARPERHDLRRPTAPVGAADGAGADSGSHRGPAQPTEHADAPPVPPPRGGRSRPGWTEGDVLTPHAGLFFLLPLMARLGMPAFLEAHPELIELDLPARLLAHAARRLRVDEADPVWSVLGPDDGAADAWDGEFTVPATWRRSVAGGAPWALRRVAARETRALTDGSWRLVLALWRGRAPPAARALRSGVALARGRPLPDAPVLETLLASWLTAMRRWCHRHAGIGLCALTARRGLLAVTRTHLDVSFGLRQVDLRIRRAGLDIDPGWVPWFGRVVQYHYGAREPGDDE